MTNEICDAQNPWTSTFCERPLGHDGPHGQWHDGEDAWKGLKAMTDPVDTDALRTQALRTQASAIRADATEAEQDWLEVADSLDAAADEVDRLRGLVSESPHADDCHWGTVMNYDELYPCTCWKADVL